MRLIDADALLEQIDTERDILVKDGRLGVEHILVHYVREFIEDAPTAEKPDWHYDEKDCTWYPYIHDDESQTERPCENCQEWDCYGCEYKQTERRAQMSEWTYTLDEVAELLCDLFGDECACNYNGIDEWLPMACKYTETGGCPNPSEKHGCWKQFLLQGAYTLKDIRQSEADTPLA